MPSSEDVAAAQNEVKEWAIAQCVREGHLRHSAEAIVQRMSYEEAVQYAEKFWGKQSMIEGKNGLF